MCVRDLREGKVGLNVDISKFRCVVSGNNVEESDKVVVMSH